MAYVHKTAPLPARPWVVALEVEVLGQLPASTVDPPCAEDGRWPTTGDSKGRTGAASSAKEITEEGALAPGEPKDQKKNEIQNVMLPVALQQLELCWPECQQESREGQTSSDPQCLKCYASETSREWTVGFMAEVACALATEPLLDLKTNGKGPV